LSYDWPCSIPRPQPPVHWSCPWSQQTAGCICRGWRRSGWRVCTAARTSTWHKG